MTDEQKQPDAIAVRIVVPLKAMRAMPLKEFKRAIQMEWARAREELLAARSWVLKKDKEELEKTGLPPVEERRIIVP